MSRQEASSDVPDPRDFSKTIIPELADLDSLLRCHICKDFLKTSVLTPCGHTFCSICIRKYLQKENKCPLCLSELTESMLQKEFLVQEICKSFLKVREPLLNHLRAKTDEDTFNDVEEIQILETRKRTFQPSQQEVGIERKKKKNVIGNLLMKKPSKQKMGQCPICEEYFPITILETTHIDECLKNPRQRKPSSSEIIDVGNYVKTPTCNDPRIAHEQIDSISDLEEIRKINVHTESYLKSGLKKSKESRLPKLDFQSISISQLKQRLGSLGLPTNGSKQQMISRYNHYEMLWNSNFLDSIDPVDENELKKQLSKWESRNLEMHQTSGKSITNMLRSNKVNNTGANMMKLFKTDRFDRKGWLLHHKRIFSELKQEALASNKKATEQKRAIDGERTQINLPRK